MACLDDEVANRGSRSDPGLEDAVRARLGVKGDFIRVAQLAKALGISSTSIHSQIRRQTFPIAHRRVGNVVLVKLSDYVNWFEDGSRGVATLLKPASGRPLEASLGDETETSVADAPSIDKKQETRSEFKARINREVLAEMRSKGFKV